MRKQLAFVTIGLVLFFGFILAASIFSTSVGRAADLQARLLILFPTFGNLIAVLAGLGLLIAAVAGAQVVELLPLAFVMLAGLLITGAHWSIAALFGTLCVAALGRDLWLGVGGRRDGRTGRTESSRRRGADRKSGANPERSKGTS